MSSAGRRTSGSGNCSAKLGHRVVHAAERDLEALVKEILGVLGAPGRVGINLLERLVAGAEPPEADAGRPRQRP